MGARLPLTGSRAPPLSPAPNGDLIPISSRARGRSHRNSQNLLLHRAGAPICVTEKMSLLMAFREARRRSHINKSLNQVIIDAIRAAWLLSQGRQTAPWRELPPSHPGIQWLPCGCCLELLKNWGLRADPFSPIHRFLNR